MEVNSLLSFSVAAYSTNQILVQWQNPYAAEGRPFSGARIIYSTMGYVGHLEGTHIYSGIGNNSASDGISQVIFTMPSVRTTYYFTATPYYSYSYPESEGMSGYVFRESQYATANTGGGSCGEPTSRNYNPFSDGRASNGGAGVIITRWRY